MLPGSLRSEPQMTRLSGRDDNFLRASEVGEMNVRSGLGLAKVKAGWHESQRYIEELRRCSTAVGMPI
jgi:hypothetical protein